MDPVLKEGLPKLFVLALPQTAATHTVTEYKWDKKYRTFYRKRTDKKSKLSQEKRANITELSVKKETFAQQSEEIGKNDGRNAQSRRRKHREACLGSLFDLTSIRTNM